MPAKEERHGDGERDERVEAPRELERDKPPRKASAKCARLTWRSIPDSETEPEQPVQRANEDAGQYGLPE